MTKSSGLRATVRMYPRTARTRCSSPRGSNSNGPSLGAFSAQASRATGKSSSGPTNSADNRSGRTARR